MEILLLSDPAIEFGVEVIDELVVLPAVLEPFDQFGIRIALNQSNKFVSSKIKNDTFKAMFRETVDRMVVDKKPVEGIGELFDQLNEEIDIKFFRDESEKMFFDGCKLQVQAVVYELNERLKES